MKNNYGFFKLILVVLLFSVLKIWGQTTLYSTDFGTDTTLPTGWTSTSTKNGWAINTSSISSGYTGASGGNNVIFNNSGTGTNYLTFSNNISTVGLTNITLLWGARGSAAFSNDITVQWSSNGSTWNTVNYTYTKNGNAWELVNGGARIPLPASAEGISNLRIRFSSTSTSTGNYRIDDFSIQGTSIGTSITATPSSLTNFTYVEGGGPSSSQSFTVSGSNLTAGITVTAPANYQVSTDNVTFLDTVSLTSSGGTVYTRLKLGLLANPSYSGNITLTSGATTQNVSVSGSVTAFVCGANEDFANIPATNGSTTYDNRSWAGNHGTWNATLARVDVSLNGKAITTNGNGSVTSPTVTGGMGKLTFNYVRAFTGTSARTIQVWVNGNKVGSDITVDPGSNTVQSYTSNINVPNSVQLELKTSGAQITIDDVVWTCYSGTSEPNINIKGNNTTIVDGDTTPSTADHTDFGSILVNGAITRTFTIENNGGANLVLDNPAVVPADGTKGFTISAQPATNPMLPYSNQTFTVTFTGATPGTYDDTIMIGSNDSDTPVYSFSIKAVITSPTVTVDKTSLTGFTYPLSQGPSATQSFIVNGSNLGGNISVNSTANWEISTNQTYDGSNVSPYNHIVLAKNASNGVTNADIKVRLKSGLAVGTYTGTITISTPGIANKTIALSGEVTAGVASIKVTGNGSTISNGSPTLPGLNNTLFVGRNIGQSQTKDFVIENLGALPLIINEIVLTGTDVNDFTIINPPVPGKELAQYETLTFTVKFAPTTVGTKNAIVSISNSDPTKNPYTYAIQGNAAYCSATGDLILGSQNFEDSQSNPLNYTITNIGTPGTKTGIISGKSASNDRPQNANFFSEGSKGYSVQGGDAFGEIASGQIFTFDHISTLSYTNISLSLKIASFSYGSTTNGIDNENTEATGPSPDAEKIDHVLIEISPDGGATWYPQTKIVANEMQVRWTFGSQSGKTGTKTYAADSNLTYFGATNAAPYNVVQINNLPAVAQLKVRITVQNNSDKELWVIDDLRINSGGLNPNIWDGTQWTRTVSDSDKVIFQGNYNSAANGTFQACQCEIQNGAEVTVAANNPIIISDFIVNNGSIVVENDASLVQVRDENNNDGTGTYTVKRNANMKRLDYTYWSSPVTEQNLKAFSPLTVNTRFYTYSETTDLFNVIDPLTNQFVPAKGYAIRAPNTNPSATYSTIPVVHAYQFSGTVNNAKLTFPLSYTPVTDPVTGLHVVAGYNLVGNPYPSNINFTKLYQNNSSKIQNKAYFWTNANPGPPTQQGSYYNGNNYATLNGTGGASALNSTVIPTRYIKVGQAFMVQAKSGNNGVNLEFANSIRDGDPNHSSIFFNKGQSEDEVQKDRYWLKLTTPAGNFNTLLIGYVEGATNEMDEDYDAQIFTVGSDAFYTGLNDEKLIIQGRAFPLNPDDVVKLGAVMFESGNYTIGLTEKEGAFANGQNIYLKDKQTGILTNLIENSYAFNAEAGVSNGRFEIIYKHQTVLATGNSNKEEVQIYRDGNRYVVKAQHQKITCLDLYDSAGRLLLQYSPNSLKAELNAETLSSGVYILKINQGNEVTTRKILK